MIIGLSRAEMSDLTDITDEMMNLISTKLIDNFCVFFQKSGVGRFLVATRDIQPMEIILLEKETKQNFVLNKYSDRSVGSVTFLTLQEII